MLKDRDTLPLQRRRRSWRYYVTTWDMDKQDFTPQKGVRTGPYTLFGLRKALRALRDLGYSASKGDCSVRVEDLRVREFPEPVAV